MENDLEARIIRLESLISLQDDLIDQLNQVITDQQEEIQQLKYDVRQLKDNGTPDPIDMNQRPPHY